MFFIYAKDISINSLRRIIQLKFRKKNLMTKDMKWKLEEFMK